MEFRDYLTILRKRWLIIVSFTIVGGLIGFAITMVTPKTYTARTESFVSATSAAFSDKNMTLQQASQYALARVQSYTHAAGSPLVVQPVIDELRLGISAAALSRHLSATNPTDTVLIDLSVRWKDPKMAAQIANAIARHMATTIESIEAPNQGDASPVTVTLLRPASAPLAPSSPLPTLNLALGLVIGIVVGIAVAVMRDQFDITVKTTEDAQAITGAGVMGLVAHNPQAGKEPLIALRPRAARAEAFRTIRTNLQFTDVDNPPRRIVISSAIEDEGKTLTACNLAITLAQAGRRVCLIEADLRRPKVADYLGVEGSVGLTNVLAGQHKLDDVLIDWNDGLLTLLSAGTIPPDPSELLSSKHMESLLASLGERYDILVIDAPPLLPVTDAAILARQADGALLIARYGHVKKDQLRDAASALRLAKARLIGVVLTFVPLRGSGASYEQHRAYKAMDAPAPKADAGTTTSPATSLDAALALPWKDGKDRPVRGAVQP